ncbi:acyl-CoA dehydrogenase family protein [Pseudoroseicyclus tamaricis]|uniref:Acyl-CoA dehydrogenase n=1 Tax=Pseudoroseicyclus tamaricis TaxID=2705421 RepID=A0A6B2K360_9RHOB|nr:acyl-CoA dehydrogenase family protein [Pseudoroseicyclus tamaricis]NDV00946.1 acyl-CoA dehydrogenase [Pseudoroseicyclus tamaricis]
MDWAGAERRSLAMLGVTPGWQRLCALGAVDDETAGAVLDAAGRLAAEMLAPVGEASDREGARVEGGHVVLPEGFGGAWAAMAEGGWIGLDLPEEVGGAGLPVALQAAAESLFDAAAPAFGMAPGAARSAGHLLAAHGGEALAEWVPALISGERAATICISEPGAGSDVGRIATKAVRDGDGWRVTGQKIWISFGDHDLAPVIGHCLLARTSEAPGTRGLSLFLVPARRGEAGVSLLRIEEKMGLHGSPTCALAFDGAEAQLIGEEGRGLAQLFAMIELMRLQTGVQGLGLAMAAADIAEAYAEERRQGGDPAAPPVPIAGHPDVARQLRELRARTELLRAAVFELAVQIDLAQRAPEAAEREEAAALAAFLMPLVKTFGAETGFDVPHRAIQVLGGAGYTRDWPLERMLRDARVLAIYEGTSGMQAIDFTERRLVRDRRGLDVFVAQAGAEAFAGLAGEVAAAPEAARLAAADAVMRAGWAAVTGWLAERIAAVDPASAETLRRALPQRFALHAAEARAALDAGPVID